MKRIFGGNYKVIPVALYEFSYDAFTGAFCIPVGGVNKITAGLCEGFQNLQTGFFICTPAPFFAKAHSAQT